MSITWRGEHAWTDFEPLSSLIATYLLKMSTHHVKGLWLTETVESYLEVLEWSNRKWNYSVLAKVSCIAHAALKMAKDHACAIKDLMKFCSNFLANIRFHWGPFSKTTTNSALDRPLESLGTPFPLSHNVIVTACHDTLRFRTLYWRLDEDAEIYQYKTPLLGGSPSCISIKVNKAWKSQLCVFFVKSTMDRFSRNTRMIYLEHGMSRQNAWKRDYLFDAYI